MKPALIAAAVGLALSGCVHIAPDRVAVAAAPRATTDPATDTTAAGTVPTVVATAAADRPAARPDVAAARSADPVSDRAASREPSAYQVQTPDQTGVSAVFDDANDTYIVFEAAVPEELILFGADGEPIKYERYGNSIVAKGIHRGILIKTYSGRSLVLPGGTLRMIRQLAYDETKPLPPPAARSIDQARARIAKAQDRLSDLSEQIDKVANGESDRPIASVMDELEQIETHIDGVTGTLVRVHFAGSSSRLALSKAGRDALVAAAHKAKTIIVRGRTDAIGAAAKRRQVARARAYSARDLLVAGGIDPHRMTVEYGLGDYVAPNTTAEGRARNRRADIILVGPDDERISVVLVDDPGTPKQAAADGLGTRAD